MGLIFRLVWSIFQSINLWGVRQLKNWIIVLIGVGTAVIGVCISAYVDGGRRDQKNQERRILIYNGIKGPLADFHGGVRDIATVGSKEVLEERLHQLKTLAQNQRAKLDQAQRQSDALRANASDFTLVIDSARKYLGSFADLATMSVQKETLSVRADTLVEILKRLEKRYDLPHAGAPDRGDMDQAIRHAAELVRNYLAKSKVAAQLSVRRRHSDEFDFSDEFDGDFRPPRQEFVNVTADTIDSVIDLASQRYLHRNDLAGYENITLTIIRNGIFARRGRMFQRLELQNYFNNRPWYHPRADFSPRWLSRIERRNANFIAAYQEHYFGHKW